MARTNGVQDLNRIDPIANNPQPDAPPALIWAAARRGTIGVDTSASAAGTNTSTVTLSYTASSGPNPLMLVSVGTDQARTVSSVTYNGVALVSVGNNSDAGSTSQGWNFSACSVPAGGRSA